MIEISDGFDNCLLARHQIDDGTRVQKTRLHSSIRSQLSSMRARNRFASLFVITPPTARVRAVSSSHQA
jgi:hypothetical protein